VAWLVVSDSSDAPGPFWRSYHCPFASRAAAPRTGVPAVSAGARGRRTSPPTVVSMLRRYLPSRLASSWSCQQALDCLQARDRAANRRLAPVPGGKHSTDRFDGSLLVTQLARPRRATRQHLGGQDTRLAGDSAFVPERLRRAPGSASLFARGLAVGLWTPRLRRGRQRRGRRARAALARRRPGARRRAC